MAGPAPGAPHAGRRSVVEAILKLVRSVRPGRGETARCDRSVAWGPGPRASQALMLTVRARALSTGASRPRSTTWRRWPQPVLQHRMAVTFAARADGVDVRDVIDRLVARSLASDRGTGELSHADPAPSSWVAQRARWPRACRTCSSRRGASPPPCARRARPPASRPGRDVLAVPPLRPGEPAGGSTGAVRRATTTSTCARREWEASQTVWLWIDLSPSMDFTRGCRRVTKLDRADRR